MAEVSIPLREDQDHGELTGNIIEAKEDEKERNHTISCGFGAMLGENS